MIVVVLRNPEPDNPIRKGVDIELRILVKGASAEEAEKIGEALYTVSQIIRPGTTPEGFILSPEARI